MIFANLDALAPYARLVAKRRVFDGKMTSANMRVIRTCTHKVRYRQGLLASVTFTRDIGHNSGGWWKNPDYERCLHLSIAFVEELPHGRIPFQKKEGEITARAFFGDDVGLSWFEGAHSEEGKACGVGHYRLFCDPGWNPFKPRGEVYNTDWTPKDWKSFSDLHGDEL